MADIITLPKRGSWEQFSPLFREVLEGGTVPPAGVEWILNDMKPRWEAMENQGPWTISVPSECEPAVGAAIGQLMPHIYKATNDYIQMALVLETQLYFALHPPPKGGTRQSAAA